MSNFEVKANKSNSNSKMKRYTLFPIEHADVWSMYKAQVAFGQLKKLI